MKKVLYIATNSDLGGISNYLLEIAKHLPDNINPYFIMSSKGYLSNRLEKLGISQEQIYFVRMTNSIFDLKTHLISNLKALDIVRKIKPDLIHCNATTGAIVGAVCGFLTKTPTIYTVHGWPFTNGITRWKQIFYKVLEFIICSVFRKIICVSEYDRQIGTKALPLYKNKIITIKTCIADTQKDFIKQYKYDNSNDELNIIMISRFCPQKDHYTLIKAVNELNKEGLNINLNLYGQGPQLKLNLDLIKKCNNSNIVYRGCAEDINTALIENDIYALISNWEGLPMGIIEAMRAKLPVIVCNVGGNSEAVIDGKNGFVIARKDKDALKDRIKRFYYNRTLLKDFGEYGRRLYEEEFTVDKMVKKIFMEYE